MAFLAFGRQATRGCSPFLFFQTQKRTLVSLAFGGKRYCGTTKEEKRSVRTRFAPSPTGSVHLGGLRTALFNYFHSKKHNGQYLLRIEDTDAKRFVPGAQENLIDVLHWAGVHHDEGPDVGGEKGPYVQSLRKEIYQHYIQMLIDKGEAYRCFCTEERLATMRENLRKEMSNFYYYDRHCYHLTESQVQENLEKGIPYTVRMRADRHGRSSWDDICRGPISFSNIQIDDQILMKSDGTPTYHFACVVDDHLMEITHVIRGEEWISSTPKHLMLYQKMGWEPPVFCHLPLLLNKDKTKLSKRQADVSVESYREKGYLQQAIVNFIALLGWSPRDESVGEVLTLPEICDHFDLSLVGKAGASVDEEKLRWLNNQHLERMVKESNIKIASTLPVQEEGEREGDKDEVVEGEKDGEQLGEDLTEEEKKSRSALVDYFLPVLKQRRFSFPSEEYLLRVIAVSCDRLILPSDLVDRFPFFFEEPDFEDPERMGLYFNINFPDFCHVMRLFHSTVLEEVVEGLGKDPQTLSPEELVVLIKNSPLESKAITTAVKKTSKITGIKPKQLYGGIRFCVTGDVVGPPVVDTLVVIGLDTVNRRFDKFLEEFAMVSEVYT